MDSQSFYTRQMLLQYGRQLVSARRLVRYDTLLGRNLAKDQGLLHAQRKAMVERVSREIVDNLIFSGSENPIVCEVREALSKERGEKLVFRYPPGELDVRIFRIINAGEEEEILGQEKQLVVEQLWRITLQTVEATMF